jgi:hypothetical protein
VGLELLTVTIPFLRNVTNGNDISGHVKYWEILNEVEQLAASIEGTQIHELVQKGWEKEQTNNVPVE